MPFLVAVPLLTTKPANINKKYLVAQTVPGAILSVKVSKRKKPRMQEFLVNMVCYKAKENDKFIEGGIKAPALRKDDSLLRTFKYTYAECVDILRIENIKFIAKNAFSFSVTFITADGEETIKFDDLIYAVPKPLLSALKKWHKKALI